MKFFNFNYILFEKPLITGTVSKALTGHIFMTYILGFLWGTLNPPRAAIPAGHSSVQ